MRILALSALLFSWPAWALEIKLIPVGDYGGARVKADCGLDGNPVLCQFDTAGRETILAVDNVTVRYPSLERVTLKGVGAVGFDCDRIEVREFTVGGEPAHSRSALRCDRFPATSSPMLGIDFFRERTFSFLFRQGELNWNPNLLLGSEPFSLDGKHKSYITFGGTIDAHPVRAFFDTGAPVTMIRPEFIAAHPKIFRASTLPPSEMMIRNKFVAYELEHPIVIQGVELKAQFVYGADLRPITGDTPLDVVLGVNHLTSADWHFDLKNLRFRVNN